MTIAEKLTWRIIAPLLLLIIAVTFIMVYVSYTAAWWTSVIGTWTILGANGLSVWLRIRKR